MNRKQFLFYAVVLAMPPTGAIAADDQDPEVKFRQATDHLIRGRRFEKAIELLREGASARPDDYRFPAALACACVSRIASLVYAASFAETLVKDRATFPKRLKDWEDAQKDPKNEDYGTVRPPVPPDIEFPIKDSDQPYRLTHEQLKQAVSALAKEAYNAVRDAARRAKTAEERGDAAYLRGWCGRLLLGYVRPFSAETFSPEDDTDGTTEALFTLPGDQKEIRAAFREATEAVPENGLYWQVLGDVATEREEQIADYKKSLERIPRNPMLWYRLFTMEMAKGFPSPDDADARDENGKLRQYADWKTASGYLHSAQNYDRSNAFLVYEEAGLLLRKTQHGAILGSGTGTFLEQITQRRAALTSAESREYGCKAVEAVERANGMPNYTPLPYRELIPRWLAVAWGYTEWANLALPWYSRLRELARALSGYAMVAAQVDKDKETGVRASRAVAGLGLRLAGDWPVREGGTKDARLLTTLVGAAIVAIGLKNIEQVMAAAGTPQEQEAAAAESDAFRARVAAYKKEVQKNLREETPYVLY